MRRTAALFLGLALVAAGPLPARAQRAMPTAGQPVRVLFSASSLSAGLFPSDLFSVADAAQLSGLRVNLPKPGCRGANATLCDDIDALNTLDGFNLQPRLTLPFSGPIDPATLSSASVFLLRLGTSGPAGATANGARIGINQILFNAALNTAFAEADEFLDQDTRYALVVTRGVRDAAGTPLAPLLPTELLDRVRQARPDRPELAAAFMQALDRAVASGVPAGDIAGISVFTTQSATAVLEKIRDQIAAGRVAPAQFTLADGVPRSVFALADLQTLVLRRQISLRPSFADAPVPLDALRRIPGAVGQIAFGVFQAPSFLDANRLIPPVGTRTGTPAVQGAAPIPIGFNLILPAGPRPANGFPVAIFGHAVGGNKNDAMLQAATLAAQGIATISINVVGHGGGPDSRLLLGLVSGQQVSVQASGLSRDVNADMNIGPTEGLAATTIASARDGLRQTTANLLQLVRVIQIGMDVDGDAIPDLDSSRIFYFGQQLGGTYGLQFLALEPGVRLGVLNATGGPLAEIGRLANAAGQALLPRRGLAAPVVERSRAMVAAQQDVDLNEWAAQSGDAVAYAPHIRKQPLAGVPAKNIIFQFARGDATVPNPTSTAIVRAGELTDRTTFLRNDLFVAMNAMAPLNAHIFLLRITDPLPPVAQLARQAQEQIATFFASGGAMTLDPDGAGTFFQTPIADALPEELFPVMAPPAPPAAMGPAPAAPARPAPGAGAPRAAPAMPAAPAPAMAPMAAPAR